MDGSEGARGRRARAGPGRRLLRLALLLGVQGLLLVVALELLGRLLDPLGISFYPESARYFDTLTVGGEIGYRSTPGLEGRFWGAPVEINSLGMRDREIAADPDGEEFRLLVMGDSIPFGIGVAYEDSIPARLAESLDAAYGGSPAFRTLNMGVPSYNTEQQLIQLRELGMGLAPDLALLLFVGNDIQPKMWVLDKRRHWVVDLSQRSYAACMLAVGYRKVRSAFGSRGSGVALGDYRVGHPRWNAVDASLTAIHSTLAEAGVPFVVFATVDSDHPARPLVEAVGRREGFPVVGLVPWEDERWPLETWPAFVNSVTDGHPNVEGSKVYTTLIHEALAELGLLPPDADR